MDYRLVLCIFAGVWAAEDMTKEEGMVDGCGRPAPKQEGQSGEAQRSWLKTQWYFFTLHALSLRSSFATEC